MTSTQQQIHVLNSLLDGALLECYWVFCSYVILSLLQHIKHLHKRPVRHVPLLDVEVDKELIHMVMKDIIAHSQETLEHDMKLHPVKKVAVTYTQQATNYTIRQLKQYASEQHIKRYSHMTKDELVKVIDFTLISK